jgi:hypothetical protein
MHQCPSRYALWLPFSVRSTGAGRWSGCCPGQAFSRAPVLECLMIEAEFLAGTGKHCHSDLDRHVDHRYLRSNLEPIGLLASRSHSRLQAQAGAGHQDPEQATQGQGPAPGPLNVARPGREPNARQGHRDHDLDQVEEPSVPPVGDDPQGVDGHRKQEPDDEARNHGPDVRLH